MQQEQEPLESSGESVTRKPDFQRAGQLRARTEDRITSFFALLEQHLTGTYGNQVSRELRLKGISHLASMIMSAPGHVVDHVYEIVGNLQGSQDPNRQKLGREADKHLKEGKNKHQSGQ